MLVFFIVLASIGILLLLLGLLTGIDFDFDFGGGDSGGAFSLPALGAFLGTSGVTGALLAYDGYSAVRVLPIAAVVGIIAWLPVRTLVGKMHSLEDSTQTITLTDYVGLTSDLLHPASQSLPGLADFNIAGERVRKQLLSDSPAELAEGDKIVVVGIASDGMTLLASRLPNWVA